MPFVEKQNSCGLLPIVFLGNMWGNAPIVLKETTAPQFNYKSASQKEIYKQCKDDLLFAIQWMPDIDDQKGGKASKVAAQHLLAEILIALKIMKGLSNKRRRLSTIRLCL